ncbi:MAG: DinB family protein [Chloroflexi bacterium]|nr:MAG: DinB family protein [Chloroflexota bacterium]
MASPGVEALLYLMDEAFEGRGIEESNESQALLTNLATVSEEQWQAKPPGAERTIAWMVVHLGTCKLMYDDYAFGSRSLFWDQPGVQPWPEHQAPMAETLAWLRDAQARLRSHIAELDDSELDRPRMTNWGEERPTRWIIAMLISHDSYHAGEINHLRSLLSGDDRWNYVRELEGG